MGKNTAIHWCHHTFNPHWGCAKVSAGCKNCYAEAWAKRTGHAVWGEGGARREFGDKHWKEPLKWNAAAEAASERRRVFCASMADVFEDHPVAERSRARLWPLIEETPWLDWLLLTKRPENHEMVPLAWQTGTRRPGNVWFGCTAEDQENADRRIPHLLAATWPAVHFVSAEPLLGPVSLILRHLRCNRDSDGDGNCWIHPGGCPRGIDWVIVGGESGGGARSFKVEWARRIVNECTVAEVACFVKQMGSNSDAFDDLPFGQNIPDRKGGEPYDWPEDLRVREFPR